MERSDHQTTRPAICAVGIYFWLVGVIVGVWVARLPEIQERLKIGNGRLGIILLMSTLGALVTMPLTGRICPLLGARRLAWGSAVLTCVFLPLIAWSSTPGILMLVMGAFGASTGVHGVVLNALAVHLEESRGRPILSSFHGLFSLGGLSGAMVAAACLSWPIGPVPSLVASALGIGLIYLGAGKWLPEVIGKRDSVLNPAGETQTISPWAAWTHGRLIMLGGFAFLGLMGEGSIGDWSAVYLTRSLQAPTVLAGFGYAAYSLGMTGGRFTGDHLTKRWGDANLLRGGASLAAFGLLLTVIVGRPLLAIFGLTLVGAGLANAVPILYRAAARTPGIEPVAGIAITSTVGYLGFLVGPPLIGLIAEQTSLGTALAVVAAAIGLVAVGGVLVGTDIESNVSIRHDEQSSQSEQDDAIPPILEISGGIASLDGGSSV